MTTIRHIYKFLNIVHLYHVCPLTHTHTAVDSLFQFNEPYIKTRKTTTTPNAFFLFHSNGGGSMHNIILFLASCFELRWNENDAGILI